MLTGLLQPSEGTLLVAGRDLRELDLGSYRSRIGVVMQDDQLFIGTVEDNISFFDPAHDAARARECARVAGLDVDIMAMPMQYNTIVGSLGVALSGGQKQRLLLARALYRKPEILFLDEAFDQLDLEREYEITDRLTQLGLGVVIVEPPAGHGAQGRPRVRHRAEERVAGGLRVVPGLLPTRRSAHAEPPALSKAATTRSPGVNRAFSSRSRIAQPTARVPSQPRRRGRAVVRS